MFQGDLLGIDYSWILVLLSFPIPVIVSEKGINYPKRGCPGYLEWLLNVKVALQCIRTMHNFSYCLNSLRISDVYCLPTQVTLAQSPILGVVKFLIEIDLPMTGD